LKEGCGCGRWSAGEVEKFRECKDAGGAYWAKRARDLVAEVLRERGSRREKE
jgi:hypothetical protein